MTNRAQAKPSKAPKDVIQEQSLLTHTFVFAGLVALSLVWLCYDDFVGSKPWKHHQGEFRDLAIEFLAEELDAAAASALLASGDPADMENYSASVRKRLEDAKQAAAAAAAALDQKLDPIKDELGAVAAQIAALESQVGKEFFLREQASILTFQRYEREHGRGWDAETYRALLNEVTRRKNEVTELKFRETQLTNRMPLIQASLDAIARKLTGLTADLETLKRSMEAYDENFTLWLFPNGPFRRDFVQIYVNHGGSGDIVDRCESCHRGTDVAVLDREKMWASHLSNDKVRHFVEKYADKDYWKFAKERAAVLAQLNPAVDASLDSGAFFRAEPGDHPGVAMNIGKIADVVALIDAKLSDEDRLAIDRAWVDSQQWRANQMLSKARLKERKAATASKSATISAQEGDTEDAADAADASRGKEFEPTDVLVKVAGKHYRDPEDIAAEKAPRHLAAAEVFIYLATNGPFALDGLTRFPDRFKFLSKSWFTDVAKDPRVHELYKICYRDFQHFIKEELLMYTAHPRREQLLGTIHARAEFGCTSCHRGTGINTKDVESAHGYQHHWLTPLFKEGFQEAGCQKCHKAEIEIAYGTRVQKGKDLYQNLGCWGCHNYQGYEAEALDKLRVSKDLKDNRAELDKLLKSVVSSVAEFDEKFSPKGLRAYRERLEMELGLPAEEAGAEANVHRARAEAELDRKHRDTGRLRQRIAELDKRMDELEVEHKRKGPNLKDLSLKVGEDKKGWVPNWIRYPKGFRPSTKMPHFFYGPFAFVEDEENAYEVKPGSEGGPNPWEGNPVYRRLNKQNVDALKSISLFVWQQAKYAAEAGDSPAVPAHNVPTDKEAADRGRLLFLTKGCMGCHSVEPDLVQGKNVVVPVVGEEGEVTGYSSSDEWVAAPRYEYRTDGRLERDGHGNTVANEFIYSFAANLSRIGEKASPDYLVEWVLQPRVRNKHGIMPSFWPVIAGTPPGTMEREELDSSIVRLKALEGGAGFTLDLRMDLADAMRRRGDISQAALDSYRAAAEAIRAASRTDDRAVAIARDLDASLAAVDQVRAIVAYLMTLRHPDLADKGVSDLLNGHVGDYSYTGKQWVDDVSLEEIDAHESGVKLRDKPKGHFEEVEVSVEGFGDYSFLMEGYAGFRDARNTQRAARLLAPLAEEVISSAANVLVMSGGSGAADSVTALRAAVASFRAAWDKWKDKVHVPQGASDETRAAWPMVPRWTAKTVSLSPTPEEIADITGAYADANDTIRQVLAAAVIAETQTAAGQGKRFTAFYGCAGCHEIEGLESEGKIGTELTEEGSKFIQRLDFGLLEYHSVPGDHHTPHSPAFIPRASLRGYDTAFQTLGRYEATNPEMLPIMRGGIGTELPEGFRERYIHSKYDLRLKETWLTGKIHSPRQWDKGRLLEHEEGWWERLRMPLFELNEEELLALSTFIYGSENMVPWGAGADALPPKYLYNHDGAHDEKVQGWWILKKYNCMGCHSIGDYEGRFRRLGQAGYGAFLKAHQNKDLPANSDGLKLAAANFVFDGAKNVPPVLHDAGARVRGEWLVSWLRNPYDVRNMVNDPLSSINAAYPGTYKLDANTQARVIMPHFYLTESEARALAAFFADRSGAPDLYVDGSRATPDSIAYGEKIFQSVNCVECHSVEQPVAGYYAPGGSAPNLRQVIQRVRRDWVKSWLRNTDSIQPRGRMPTYFEYNVAAGRWVMKEQVDGNEKRPHVNPADKSSPILGYDGDQLDALVDWLYEGLPNRSAAEVQALIDAAKAK